MGAGIPLSPAAAARLLAALYARGAAPVLVNGRPTLTRAARARCSRAELRALRSSRDVVLSLLTPAPPETGPTPEHIEWRRVLGLPILR